MKVAGYERAYWTGDGGRRWASLAAVLDRHHAPVTELLAARAVAWPGERVLDVGCGQGTLARRLAAKGADVTAADLSPELLDLARVAGPERVHFVEADAATQDFGLPHFSLIASQFGTMFFEDSRAAFAHLRGQTAEGGQLVFAAWGAEEDNPWFALPRAVAAERIGEKERDLDGPGPMRFRDIGAVTAMLSEAGWHEAEGEAVALELTPPGGRARAADFATRMGGASAILTHHGAGEPERLALRDAIAEVLRPFERENGEMRVPALVNLFTART